MALATIRQSNQLSVHLPKICRTPSLGHHHAPYIPDERHHRRGRRCSCRSDLTAAVLRTSLGRGYDVVVVGAGPAGLTVAKELADRTSLNILIVESGSNPAPSLAVRLRRYGPEAEATGTFDAAYYAHHNRRAFGGTSTVWSGWCAVLEERSFLAGEWPLSYRELYAYYPKAAAILNLPTAAYERPEISLPGADGNIVYRPYYFSRTIRRDRAAVPLRFSHTHDDWARRASVDILLDHTATGLRAEGDAVAAVGVCPSTPGAKPVWIGAGRVVLAAGGIQNPRLLQLSFGERWPAVGRYFADHPHMYRCADLQVDKEAIETAMAHAHPDGLPSEDGLGTVALSSTFAHERSLPSVTADLENPVISRDLLAGRHRATVAASTTIRAEMRPNESNTVTLSKRDDMLGVPMAHATLDLDVAAAEMARRALDAELVRTGLGRMRLRPAPVITGGGHMVGTTRMGRDPNRSVADATAKVHGITNLFIAGSSLFPAMGAANPTLTIVALAVRLAEHLASTGSTAR